MLWIYQHSSYLISDVIAITSVIDDYFFKCWRDTFLDKIWDQKQEYLVSAPSFGKYLFIWTSQEEKSLQAELWKAVSLSHCNGHLLQIVAPKRSSQ